MISLVIATTSVPDEEEVCVYDPESDVDECIVITDSKDPQQSLQQKHETDPTYEQECGLYFAPSSIPGAGYGVFNGKNTRQPKE